VLELRGVRHRYEGRTVLDLDRFTVERGTTVAIAGPNGSGKSTLLRLAALVERPTEGEVWLDGRRASPSRAFRSGVTLVEQRPVLFRGTVRENLAYGLRVRGMARAAANDRLEATARRLDLLPLLERRRSELSEGETQRVAVARALVVESEVLLLDEPVSSADRTATQQLFRMLQEERARRPLTVCLASHQLEDAYRWSDDLRVLADGRLAPVTPENLFRVDIPPGAPDTTRHVPVGPITISVATERIGPAILAVAPSDIFVSREPVASSARNVFSGHVTRLARSRPGGGLVHVTADVGIELVAAVTEEAVRELALSPGATVTFAFKASAVRVF
jgi:tungstate transport system ATP-binding protein